ncbi:MAG: oxidoreductase [Flavobacteriaceae bacterium]|nr:oxidoreductase [Flavobacteriaceae bacterium]
MKKACFLLLSSLLAIRGLVSQDLVYQNIEHSKDAELLFETSLEITQVESFGVNPAEIFTTPNLIPPLGLRINTSYEGSTDGDISGQLALTDYGTIMPYGLLKFEGLGSIKTKDGATISVRSRGEIQPTQALIAPFGGTAQLVTHHPNYKHLNELFIYTSGLIDRSKNTLILKFYGLENNPFGEHDPYARNLNIDYTNFPFNAKSIEEDPRATLVYEVNANPTGIETFGVDIDKVFSGQEETPKNGLRMDVPFTGTVSGGEIDGVISGVDYITVLPNGNTVVDVHGIIEADSGEKIALKVDGIMTPTEEQGVYEFYETLNLQSTSEKFNYLNNQYFIGIGTTNEMGLNINVRIYRFDKNPLTIKPQVVLITGTAYGMGKAHAERLIKEGHIVYGGDKENEANQYLNEMGGHALQMDVTNQQEVVNGVAKIMEEHGRIDVLVNNAGYGLYGPVEEVTLEDAIAQFDVNLFGVARVTKEVLPHMRNQRSGKIINITSMGGEIYTGLGAWYHATKHALEGWSDCLRLEVREFDIDVVVVQPGIINTNFYNTMFESVNKYAVGTNYGHMFELMYQGAENITVMSQPQEISEVINEIVESVTPKTRYLYGFLAKTWVDYRRQFGDEAYDDLLLGVASDRH